VLCVSTSASMHDAIGLAASAEGGRACQTLTHHGSKLVCDGRQKGHVVTHAVSGLFVSCTLPVCAFFSPGSSLRSDWRALCIGSTVPDDQRRRYIPRQGSISATTTMATSAATLADVFHQYCPSAGSNGGTSLTIHTHSHPSVACLCLVFFSRHSHNHSQSNTSVRPSVRLSVQPAPGHPIPLYVPSIYLT
jgi:hypothetical protein